MSRIGISWFGGRSHWAGLLSLAFLVRHKPVDADITIFLLPPRQQDDFPHFEVLRLTCERLREAHAVQKVLVMEGYDAYSDAIPAAMQWAPDLYRYAVLHLDTIVIGGGAIEMMIEVLEGSAELSRPFGLVSGHLCLGTNEYRPRACRSVGSCSVATPYKKYVEGLSVFDLKMLDAGFEFAKGVGRELLDGEYWVQAVRDVGYDVGLPFHPVVPLQRLSKQQVVTPMQENNTRTHKDRQRKEVVIDHFDLDDFRFRGDEQWEAEACRRMADKVLSGASEGLTKAFFEGLEHEPRAFVPVIIGDTQISRPIKELPNDDMIGAAFLCCNRWYHAALALTYFFAHRTPKTHLHAYVDKPREGEVPPRLVQLLSDLTEAGYIRSVMFHPENVGLTQNITTGVTQLATSGEYDYVLRLEDDMLLGPRLLPMMLDVMRQSAGQERPFGLLSGQVSKKHQGLRPIRYVRTGNYTVGIHGHNSLEGCTLLRVTMAEKGFTWALEHPKAYNSVWLDRMRAHGFDGGTIVEPVGQIQHIGYATTVPAGTPVTPAREWKTERIISLPHFDFTAFRNARLPENEAKYVLRAIRAMAIGFEPRLAEILLTTFLEPAAAA